MATAQFELVKFKVDFLGGTRHTKMMNDMMHAFDVFEPGKQYVDYTMYPLETSDTSMLEWFCEKFARAMEASGGYAVFVGIRSIAGEVPQKPHVWFMDGIHSLSMTQEGKHGWGLFKDVLAQLGYKATTDSRMRVTSIE